jgi:hypothetical protein
MGKTPNVIGVLPGMPVYSSIDFKGLAKIAQNPLIQFAP